MNKKPLIKDAVEYFNKEFNWITIYHDKTTDLIIDKLVNVNCLRLCLANHKINAYVQYDFHELMYFYPAKRIEDIHTTPCYTSLTYGEIKDLIRYHWEEES